MSTYTICTLYIHIHCLRTMYTKLYIISTVLCISEKLYVFLCLHLYSICVVNIKCHRTNQTLIETINNRSKFLIFFITFPSTVFVSFLCPADDEIVLFKF